MKLVSYHQDATKGDYLVCQPPGTDATVKVAVGPELQSGLQSQRMPDGAVGLLGLQRQTPNSDGQLRCVGRESNRVYHPPVASRRKCARGHVLEHGRLGGRRGSDADCFDRRAAMVLP